MNRIKTLDGLRGLFCILILFEHYSPSYIHPLIYEFPLIRHSYIVVDFFFVLSGYILSLKYSNAILNVKDLKEFYLKRIFRLYPLLFITSSIMLVIEIIVKFFFPLIKNDPNNLKEIFFRYLNDVLLINSTKILGEHAMNIPSWSISAEFFCYIIFGALILIFKRKTKNVFLLFIAIISTLFLLYNNTAFPTFSYGFIRGIVSFSLGALVHEATSMNYKKQVNSKYQYLVLIVFMVSLILLGFRINLLRQIIGVFLPIFFSFSIYVLLNSNGFLTSFLNNKFINKIGEISFSVYLNHFVVVLILPRIIFEILKVPNIFIYQLTVFLISPIIVIILSIYTNRYIEVFVNNYLRKKYLKNT